MDSWGNDWQARAADLQKIADCTNDVEARGALLKLVQGYLRLAKQADERAARG